ncbi:MAG TPA: glucose-1-phosphate adenylyltransferase [Selenomonadales bacterium]|nr:glucose-1-phosphate adenylyltransferase [Selenomonadales bacterium]
MKDCVAVILAGGQGSRLSVLTKNLAKPAIPFGGRYRIIDFSLSNCYNSAIDTVGILTQYQTFALHSHVGGGKAPELPSYNGGVFILPPYLKESGGEWYKGTANAVYQNIEFVDRYDPKYLLVLSGDHVYKMDYRPLLSFHQEKEAEITIAVVAVPWEEAGRFGIMNIDQDFRVTEFEEKPAKPRSNLASMGIYVFNWPAVKAYLMADEQDGSSSHDFGRDVIPRMLREGRSMFAYPFEGYWMDVGTPESLWKANMDLLREDAPIELRDQLWPIYTVDPVRPPHYINNAAVTRQALVSEGCQIYGEVENSILFPGVSVGPGAVVKNSVLMPNATVGANTVIMAAIIGSETHIEENCAIGLNDPAQITVVGQGLSIPGNTTIHGAGDFPAGRGSDE